MKLETRNWDVSFLRDNPVLKSERYGIPAELKHIYYPIRLLRYWFMYHFLREETVRKNRPLSVCEIGVDTGQMLGFMHAAASNGAPRVEVETWDAVDAIVQREILEPIGYKHLYQADLEDPAFGLGAKGYDAMILLHVLEHLFDPEHVVKKLAVNIKPGGMMIGGCPSTPAFFAKARQEKIRPKARKYGHVSVFSPQRVQDMAEQAELQVALLSGAYFMRKKGFVLENSAWWLRFNVWFGARFPSWPGEMYWILRKPQEAVET